MTIRDLFITMGFRADEDSLNEIEDKISGLKGFALQALGAIGIGFSIMEANALAEEFNGINDQIRNATRSLGDQKEIQEKIMNAANDTKSSYADTAKMVSMLVQENSELFSSVDEAIEFNNATTKLFKAAGKTNEEIAGLMEAVNKSFAKGKIDSETISQLLERSPEAVALLNKQLGSSTEQLEDMATEGRISLTDLKNAFILNQDEIDKSFGELSYSISDALLHIRNKWGYWLDDMNSTLGLSEMIAKWMVRTCNSIMDGLTKVANIANKVIEKMGGIEKVFRLISILAPMVIGAFKGKQILDFLKKASSLLNIANLKIMALIGIIILIGLVVEDFISFMKGENSVIGEVLGKIGIDAEAVKDKITSAWKFVEGILTEVWEGLQKAARFISEKIKSYWVEHGEEIKEKLSNIFNGLLQLLSIIWDSIEENVTVVFQGIKDFWDAWGDEILSVFDIIFETIGELFQNFLDILQGIIDFITGVFTGDWEKAWEGIKEIFGGLWNSIVDIVTGIWDAIYTIFGDKIDKIVEKVTGFVKIVKEKIQGVKEFFGGVKDFFDGNTSTAIKNTTVQNVAGGGNKTNHVNQDVKINNTYYGTDQRTMANGAKKAASDTTAQLARGLKYGT